MKKATKVTPYSRFEGDDLILRDDLAIDRTLLANERTLLAYLRAAVALVIAGASIIHFSQAGWFWTVGIACLPGGVAIGIVGVLRYRHMNSSISLVRRRLEDSIKGDTTNAERPPCSGLAARSAQG